MYLSENKIFLTIITVVTGGVIVFFLATAPTPLQPIEALGVIAGALIAWGIAYALAMSIRTH